MEAFGRGEALSNDAFRLNKEFEALGVSTAIVTGYVMDPPGPETEIHIVAPVWWIKLRRKIKNYWMNKLLSIFIAPSFHIFSAIYVFRKKEKLGVVVDHTGIGGHVMLSHGCSKEEVKRRWESGERAFLFYPLNLYRLFVEWLRYKLQVFKIIVTVSEYTKKSIVKHYRIDPKIVYVIPNGANLELIKENERLKFRTNIRKKYDIPQDGFLCLFVGHNFELKGLYLVIEALKYVDDALLMVVGRGRIGRAHHFAKKLGVSNRIIFTGPVPDVRPYYAAADVFVFPSSYESFSNVTLEAIVSGTPVLVTEVGGVDQYFKEGVHGWFIKQDPMDIARKIKYLKENPESFKADVFEIKRIVREMSWRRVAERHLELYREVFGNN